MKATNKFASLFNETEIEFVPTVAILDSQTIAINQDVPDTAENSMLR